MCKIYIITGPSGVGKTTLTTALARKLQKCAILEGDELYHQVVGGVSPWQKGNHLNVFWKNVVTLTKNYLDAGIDVIFNYIVTYENLEFLKSELEKYQMHFVILMASRDEIISRDEINPKGLQISRVDAHLKQFTSKNFDENHMLDTTKLNVNEEVKEVLSGRFLVRPTIKFGLQKRFYELIKAGSKIYEIRLNDEKRQNIRVFDTIFFGLEPDRNEWIQKQVTKRIEIKSPEELAKKIRYYEAGFNSLDEMIKVIHEIYNEEDIKTHGLVVFKLR